jgi:hypothetical protein
MKSEKEELKVYIKSLKEEGLEELEEYDFYELCIPINEFLFTNNIQ